MRLRRRREPNDFERLPMLDFRLANVDEPMRSFLALKAQEDEAIRQHAEMDRRRRELDEQLRQHHADARRAQQERERAERAEAWKRGEPIPAEQPKPEPLPVEAVLRAQYGYSYAMGASHYPSASGIVQYDPDYMRFP